MITMLVTMQGMITILVTMQGMITLFKPNDILMKLVGKLSQLVVLFVQHLIN